MTAPAGSSPRGHAGPGGVTAPDIADHLYADSLDLDHEGEHYLYLPQELVESTGVEHHMVMYDDSQELEGALDAHLGNTHPRRQVWDGVSSPKHGDIDAKGRIWSSDYNAWLDQGAWMFDEQQKRNFADLKKKYQAERRRAWDAYFRGNGEPPYAESIYRADQALAAAAMKRRLIESAEKSVLKLSNQQLRRMERHMDKAIEAGASPEVIREMAKGFYRHEMDQARAVAAEQEIAEITATFWADRFENVLTAATGTLGLAGVGLELGAYTYLGYLDGNATAGLKKAARMQLPTATIDWMLTYCDPHSQMSAWGIFGAMAQDALVCMGTYTTFNDLKAGRVFGEPIVKAGGLMLDDALEMAARAGKAELAFLSGRKSGLAKVNRFQEAFDMARSDALKKGAAFRLDDYPTVKEAWWGVMHDKNAMQMLNKQHPDFIINFNSTKKAVYASSDALLNADLNRHYRAKYGQNLKKVEMVKPTNPKTSLSVSASFDRDVTARVTIEKNGREITFDVPESEMRGFLNASVYDSAGRPPREVFDPDGIGDILCPGCSDATVFSEILGDQVGTYRMSADAYGHSPFQLESALYGFEEELFINNMELGRTYRHKGLEWFEKVDKLNTAAGRLDGVDSMRAKRIRHYAQAYQEEGCRQLTKQWRNQIVPGITKVHSTAVGLGIPPPPPPPGNLGEAMTLLGTIGTTDATGRMITPTLVECQVKMLGFDSIDDVALKGGDYLIAYEHSVSSNKHLRAALAEKGLQARLLHNRKYPEAKVLTADPINLLRGN
jgi:hypothetical protein